MNATTTHRDLAAILADLNAIRPGAPLGDLGLQVALRAELEDAVRARLAPLPEGEAGRLAAGADRTARTMAPPVPGVTRNGGYTVRAVIHMHDAEPGLMAEWLVACEAGDGRWVTWHAYEMTGERAGQLTYEGGNYFPSVAGTKVNRQLALADLAIRAGTMSDIGLRIADEITRYHAVTGPYTSGEREDRRMASRLRKWCQPF